MSQLLEAGVHFGHQTRRWNPKMRRFIHSERSGIYVIDLRLTVQYLTKAYAFTRDLVADGGTVLFVGTKKQARETIEYQAQRVGMPYVTERWMGGMLTNFETVKKRISRLKELEAMASGGTHQLLPKKEVIGLEREHVRLLRDLGGIRQMTKLPDAVWIVDTVIEDIAVREANRLKIPVVAILDTNCDPDTVQYPIPGNDDAIRSSALLTRVIADAVADGLRLRASRTPDEELRVQAERAAATDTTAAGPAAEPKAAWEIELERQQAAEQAAQAGARSDDQPAADEEGTTDEPPLAPPPDADPAADESAQPSDPGAAADESAQPSDPGAAADEPSQPEQSDQSDQAEQPA